MEIKSEIKQREKEQRLIGLQTAYFRLKMDLAAYEANNDKEGIDLAKKQIESCEKSYAAIENITTE